jgi:hypothetical protein
LPARLTEGPAEVAQLVIDFRNAVPAANGRVVKL